MFIMMYVMSVNSPSICCGLIGGCSETSRVLISQVYGNETLPVTFKNSMETLAMLKNESLRAPSVWMRLNRGFLGKSPRSLLVLANIPAEHKLDGFLPVKHDIKLPLIRRFRLVVVPADF